MPSNRPAPQTEAQKALDNIKVEFDKENYQEALKHTWLLVRHLVVCDDRKSRKPK